jgi:hypothetical protein
MYWHCDCFSIINCLCSLRVMKQKLIILFILTFFLSTTGLPISLHYCQMQGSSSLSTCDMCTPKQLEDESSCCEKEDEYPVQFASKNLDACCLTQIIESSVEDGFLIIANNIKIDVKNFSSALITSIDRSSLKIEKYNFNFSDSSPPLTSNNIYLLNSVFLI